MKQNLPDPSEAPALAPASDSDGGPNPDTSPMPEAVVSALGLDARSDGAVIKARLEAYVGLLLKWQRHINLIGPATAVDVWRRHILDCGQLLPLLPPGPVRVCDLGCRDWSWRRSGSAGVRARRIVAPAARDRLSRPGGK